MEAMPTEYAILGLLLNGPKHGYELARHFSPETALGEICHLEMSMLYALLKKQEKVGHIEAEMEIQGSRPPRRIFHLTALGRSDFMEWVRTPVERSREIRLDFLIKLYFARHLGNDDVLALIDRQFEVCQALLDRLEGSGGLGEDGKDTWQPQPVSFDYSDDEEDIPKSGKRSHPRLEEHERNRDATPEEKHFAGMVKELRLKQNQAIMDWLRETRYEMANIASVGGY